MWTTIDEAKSKIDELETLVSSLRHDVRGKLTVGFMVADRLCNNADPIIERAGKRIVKSIDGAIETLNASRAIVAPRKRAAMPHTRNLNNRSNGSAESVNGPPRLKPSGEGSKTRRH